MRVPKEKVIWIGNKKYKAGKELPTGYTLKDEKKKTQPIKKDDK